jgi:hypothetical protein
MKCITCSAEIPPAFVHAIETNVCPGCAGPIMSDDSKTLMTELAEAMQRMPNDPQGLAGWILSNYKIKKIGAAEPVEKFHRKGSKSKSDEDIDTSNLKIDPTYNNFLKRTDQYNAVTDQKRIAKLKNIKDGKMSELAKTITTMEDPYGDDTVSSIAEEDGVVDPEDQKVYNEMKKSGLDIFASQKMPSTGITDLSEVISSNDILSLQQENDSDLIKAEKELARTKEGMAVLQTNRLKKIKAQDALESGGGSFRR